MALQPASDENPLKSAIGAVGQVGRRFCRTAACVSLIAGPCSTALAQPSSACRGEPTRSMLIGGAAGAAFVFGMALRSDRDHRITANERLPDLWGATWGAVLGSAVGRVTATHRCPDLRLPSPALPTGASDCRRATWSGTAKGAVAGGLGGFLVAPFILLVPAIAASASGHHFDFDRGMLITTGMGIAVGAPAGAYRAHVACVRSLGGGALGGPMQDGTSRSAGQSEAYWPLDRTGRRR
jgi:hypothetical protein